MTQGGGAQPPRGSPPRILAEHYSLDRELGRGGMATVFLCTDLRDGREVAFKVLSPEFANTVTRERFLREVAFVSLLEHPSIPKVIEAEVVGEDPFYVMTYVAGLSLRERLDRDKVMPIDEAVRIAREIVKPMAYAHERSIVDRDRATVLLALWCRTTPNEALQTFDRSVLRRKGERHRRTLSQSPRPCARSLGRREEPDPGS